MNSARRFARRALPKGRKSHTRRSFVRRGLMAERLESRNLLAGDWFVSDYWNGARPEDVNADNHISPLDALLIINELNTSGSRQLMGGATPISDGEGETGSQDRTYYDVNNDGHVAPIDALLVINALNGEGEPDLVAYKVYVVNVGTPVTELATPPASITSIPQGQDYEVVVTVQDLRSGSQFGVAAGFADLLYDKSKTSVYVNELQDVVVSGSPTGGTFRLSFGGQDTGPITFNAFNSTTTANNIDAALEGLSTIGAGNVQVTAESTGFRVRFVNALGDQDVGALSVLSTSFTGGSNPSATIDVVADGVPTDPVAFEDAHRSRPGYPDNPTGGPNPAFYRGQPLFWAVEMATGVDDLGGAYLTVDPPHPGTFERELARVRMNADDGGQVTFSLSLDDIDTPAHQTLLYASQPQDRSVVDPPDISLPAPVTLTITELVNANPDVVNIAEDSGPVTFNPIAGVPGGSPANGQDVKNVGSDPAPLRITAVNGQTSGTINVTGGTVTFSSSPTTPSITFTPAANFSGQSVFTYTISDTVNTDTTTVTVNVSPVNDPPVNRINGAAITAGTPARNASEDTPFVFNAANSSVVSVADIDSGASANNEFQLTVTNGTLTLSSTTGLTPISGANGTNNMRFSGSLASINAALNGMTYNPTSNFNGNATLTISYSDQGNTGGGNLTDTDTLTINVAAVNDAPVNTVPGQQTVDESPDTLTFSTANANRITVADIDAGGTTTFEVEVKVNNGALNVVDTGNVTIQNDNTATVTVIGTIVNINTALDGLIYSPAPLFVGMDTLTVTSDDGGATGSGGPKTDIDTVAIDVLATVRPRARPDGYARTESDGAFTMNVMVNDLAHLGGAPPFETTLLSFTQPLPAGRGTVTRADNGTPGDLTDDQLIYTPPAGGNFFGTVVFQYTINDTFVAGVDGPGPDADSTTTVTITIAGENDAPTAVDDGPGAALTTNEDTPLTTTLASSVLNNDTDPDNQVDVDGDGNIDITDTLSAVIATNPANGNVTLNLDGTFTYTPNLNFNGTDTFTYRARDAANALSSPATVTITVNPVNDQPVANPDSYSVDEDTTLTANGVSPNPAGVLANDNDGDPELTQPLTVDLGSVTQPRDAGNVVRGTVSMSADGTFTYTPPASFNGTVTFQYRASDGQAQNPLSAATTVTIVVNPVNDPPVVANDSYTVAEDAVLTANGIGGNPVGVLNNDTDIDSPGLAINFPLIALPANGVLLMNGNGTFTYTPNANFFGTDSFQYRATDGFAASNAGGTNNDGIATVTITVTAVADPPIANPDTYSTTEDTPLVADGVGGNPAGVLNNDTDPDSAFTVNLSTVTLPRDAGNVVRGSVSMNANGTFTYTPPTDFIGLVTFQYRATDGSLNSNLTTVTIDVGEVNDPPTANDDDFTAIKDFVDQVVNVLANDTFAPDVGETLRVVAVQGVSADASGDTPPQPTNVAGGTVRLDNFVVLYTSPPGYEGGDFFTYTITDSRAVNPLTDSATVNVEVLAFIPKIVEGIVYQDSNGDGLIYDGDAFTDTNGNGVYDGDGRFENGSFIGEPFALNAGPRPNHYDPPERRLAGVTVQLFGSDFLGNPVGTAQNPILAVTDTDGRYQFLGDASTQFLGLKPGSYTVRQVQPAYLVDGLETENSLLAARTADNEFQTSWGPEDFTGHITGLNFGEGAFNTNAATGGFTNSGGLLAEALLASSRRNGLSIALDLSGNSIWSWSMPGWENLHHVELILDADEAHATLRVWDNAHAGQVNPSHEIRIHQETSYNGGVDSPPAGSLARFRVLGRGTSGLVIRIDGTAEEFGLDLAAAVPAVGAGEAEGEAVDQEYAEAVDAVFGDGSAWA